MWQLAYDLFTSEHFLGGAMSYESTAIIARYLAIGFSIGIFCLICAAIIKFIKIIIEL